MCDFLSRAGTSHRAGCHAATWPRRRRTRAQYARRTHTRARVCAIGLIVRLHTARASGKEEPNNSKYWMIGGGVVALITIIAIAVAVGTAGSDSGGDPVRVNTHHPPPTTLGVVAWRGGTRPLQPQQCARAPAMVAVAPAAHIGRATTMRAPLVRAPVVPCCSCTRGIGMVDRADCLLPACWWTVMRAGQRHWGGHRNGRAVGSRCWRPGNHSHNHNLDR